MSDKPQVILPEEDQTRRFVQLIIDGEDYFRVGDSPRDIHAQILGRTLREEFEIPFELKKVGIIDSIPERKGERYEAIGMGLVSFCSQSILIGSMKSVDYDIGPNREQIERFRQRGLITQEVKFL